MNKKVTKVISLMAVFSCVAIAFTSCEKRDPNSPGVEFMPDMYRSPSLETNMAYVGIENGKETGDTMQANRMPVAGTIARGYLPYSLPATAEGYEASAGLRNPLENSAANLKMGEEMYGKFCVHCHGASGAGDGSVGTKLPGPPPTYESLKNLAEGKMFHTITYGKGLMGAHASLMSPEERWQVVLYIQKLQFPNGRTATTDTTATVPKESPGTKTEEPKK
jgi:mono/diheme cytochrome c family protein